MQVVRLFVFMTCCFSFNQALTCDRCQGTPEFCSTNLEVEDCTQFGADTVCANFFHFSQGKAQVQKGCYQASACRTQESRDDNSCGEFDGKDKSCRCCCTEDRCNKPDKGCIVSSECGVPKKKPIGKYVCPNTTTSGSVCNFTCPANFDQLGSPTIKCIQENITGNLAWYPTNQRCNKIRCKALKAPENGNISCTNTGRFTNLPDFIYLQTRCRLSCVEGYRLVGPSHRFCKSNGQWTSNGQFCQPNPCSPLAQDKNRIDSCSNGNLVGSICTFKCEKGYKLIGEKESKCIGLRKLKIWDKKPPRCMKVRCYPMVEVGYELDRWASCSNSNFENSDCHIGCGYMSVIEGTTDTIMTVTCTDDGDGDEIGEWSTTPRRCVYGKCPKIKPPTNGNMICNRFGRQMNSGFCYYSCNVGYDLHGTSNRRLTTFCRKRDVGGQLAEWSIPRTPTCTKIRCMPPHTDPENGRVTCSDANNFKSSCKFTCNEGYDLAETKKEFFTSDCEDDGDGDALWSWSKPPATCVIKKCRPVIQPEHSSYICTNDHIIGSTCTFQCDFGWKGVGEMRMTCSDKKYDGDAIVEWSAKEPYCKRIWCLAQKHDNTVASVCKPNISISFPLGTVCTYQCAREGYYLVSYNAPQVTIKSGRYDVRCLSTSKWNNPAPTCIEVKCRPVIAPENGHRPFCTDGNWLGSTCTFSCLPTYVLTHAKKLRCVTDENDADKFGVWDNNPPLCKKNECEDYGKINNGKISYSDKLNIGSIMTLVCNNQFTFKHHETAKCLPADESKGQKVPYWSRRREVCCVPCIFHNRLRIVTLIDKTATQTYNEWQDIAMWQYHLTEYLFANNFNIKYSVILYDERVDEVNSMSEKLLRKSEELDDIRFDLQEKPLFGGNSSNTVKAMEYVEENIFKGYRSNNATSWSGSSDEPFIVLVKRRGSATADEVAAAKSLLKRGVYILALGFPKDDWEKEESELVKLTGDIERVRTMAGFHDLEAPGIVVMKMSRNRGCRAVSKTRPCT